MILFVLCLTFGLLYGFKPTVKILPHWKLRKVKGTSLQMKCEANTPTPPVSMKWWFINLERNVSLAISKGNYSISLSINKLKVHHAGAYICVVKLDDGNVINKEAVVFIVDKEMPGPCNEYHFICKKPKLCIAEKFRCNGIFDCPDKSDEENCIVLQPTYAVTKNPDPEIGTIFVQTAVYSVIGCTIGVILLISVLIIAVFRIRMKRAAVRRAATPNDLTNRSNATVPSSSAPGPTPLGTGNMGPLEYDPFLPANNQQQSQYGNIIVTANNGVQYVPGSEYPPYIEPPPPYSTVMAGRECSPPPPYSTIDRAIAMASSTAPALQTPVAASAPEETPSPIIVSPPVPTPQPFIRPQQERNPPILTPPILADPTQTGELPRPPVVPNHGASNSGSNPSTDGHVMGHIVVKDGKIILMPKNS